MNYMTYKYNTIQKSGSQGFFYDNQRKLIFTILYIKMIKWDIKCKYNLMMQ